MSMSLFKKQFPLNVVSDVVVVVAAFSTQIVLQAVSKQSLQLTLSFIQVYINILNLNLLEMLFQWRLWICFPFDQFSTFGPIISLFHDKIIIIGLVSLHEERKHNK